jgi:hypothetical protein
MLPLSPGKAVLRRTLGPKSCLGLPRRKHGLCTSNSRTNWQFTQASTWPHAPLRLKAAVQEHSSSSVKQDNS